VSFPPCEELDEDKKKEQPGERLLVQRKRALKTKKQIFKVVKYAETQCPLEGIPYRDLKWKIEGR
jgi:hypothetical protein